jgi:hypothetical protein
MTGSNGIVEFGFVESVYMLGTMFAISPYPYHPKSVAKIDMKLKKFAVPLEVPLVKIVLLTGAAFLLKMCDISLHPGLLCANMLFLR